MIDEETGDGSLSPIKGSKLYFYMINGLLRALHLCHKESTASWVYASLRSLQYTHPPDELQPLMTNTHNPTRHSP